MDRNQRDLAGKIIVKFKPTGQSGCNIASGSGFSTAVEQSDNFMNHRK